MSTAMVEAPAAEAPLVKINLAEMQKQSDFTSETTKGVFGQGFNFLPRLQLFTSNSDEVKMGKIGLAHYGLVKGQDEILDLGETVLVMPLVYRSKAMFTKTADGRPLAYHKAESPEYIAIRDKANADSNSGNMYGPEFLVWMGETHGFATFYMCSKTARNEATRVAAFLPRPDGTLRTGVLKAVFINPPKSAYSWHGPKIEISSQSLPNPDPATTEQVSLTFLKPIDSVPEAPKAAAPADAVQGER